MGSPPGKLPVGYTRTAHEVAAWMAAGIGKLQKGASTRCQRLAGDRALRYLHGTMPQQAAVERLLKNFFASYFPASLAAVGAFLAEKPPPDN